MAGNAIQKASP